MSLRQIGTVIAVLALAGGGLVAWNAFGRGPYGDRCEYWSGCRSFYCLHHEQAGTAQVSSPGHCTKSCTADAECGAGAVCVVLTEGAQGDLPPIGRPVKACMVRRESPSDIHP